MKVLWLLFFGFLTLSVAVFAADKDVKEVVFVADPWCPYNCEPGSDMPGYVIEIAQAVFKEHGIKFTYKTMPWARALEEIKNGKVTGAIGASDADVKTYKVVLPKEEFAHQASGFFVKKGNPWKFDMNKAEDSIKKLKNKIGMIEDYTYFHADFIKSVGKDARIGGDKPLEQMISMLMMGRLDAFIEDPAVAKYTFNQMKKEGKVKSNEDIEFVGSAENPIPLYVGFCSKCKKEAKIFGEGFAKLRANGKLKQILDKYSVSDWKK